MRLQTGLLSLFLIALVLAPYVDASARKNKKKKKGKNKKVPILSDNSAERGNAVTLPSPSVLMPNSNTSSLVQSVPEESQVSERDEQVKKFEELIKKRQYKKIVELGEKMSDEELLKCFCQVVTTLDQFKDLYEYLKQHDMVPGFLAHGKMVLVRKVIVESSLLETNELGECNSIYDAVALSLKEDHHDRVANLFEAAQERPDRKNMFGIFLYGFFIRYPPERDSMPLKRFLTLHGEELSKQHPEIFENICQILVGRLNVRFNNLAPQKLLIDLVGQHSLLTPVAFAEGFLHTADDALRANFIKYGWREAIKEGLMGRYRGGGEGLWTVMVSRYPNQFSGDFPGTNEARRIALKDLPTKQDKEREWAEENAPDLRVRLEEFMPGLFPPVPLTIISEYAITWISVPSSPLQEHSANVEAQESVLGIFNKLPSGEVRLDGIAAQPKAVQKVVDKVTKPLADKRQSLEDIIDHSGLRSINPYDDNPVTKYYLSLGCHYLAQSHAKKYETESIQKKQREAYHRNCLHAVWPGSNFDALPSNQCHLKQFDSFAKGDVLTRPDMQPSFVAREDGFMLSQTADYSFLVYYHKDKPPMNLDVLSKLQWPHSRDLLSSKDTDIKAFSVRSRKEQSNQFNAFIKPDSKHAKHTIFADLKHWVQRFDLSKYDPVQLKAFREQLNLKYPGIHLNKVQKLGTRTSVEPLYDPFVPIPPGATIAFRYDPEVFTPPENVTNTRRSTIITDFEHQGSKYCLVLSFDLPG